MQVATQQAHRNSVPVQNAANGPAVQYVNFCRVTGSPEELMLDFALLSQPQESAGDVNAERRIVMTPFTAKRMLGALGAAVRHYEQVFGTIETDARNRVRRAPAPAASRSKSVRPQVEPVHSVDPVSHGTTSDAMHVTVEPIAVPTA